MKLPDDICITMDIHCRNITYITYKFVLITAQFVSQEYYKED